MIPVELLNAWGAAWLGFAPDGTGLATGGADRTIKLWDVPADVPSLSLSAQR
ncbi:MAG: WD40 repeat domain-containing protein [Isosphaerales bacterium]